jgi:hypothetical protein
MAGGLHGSARTTPRVRAELQRLQEATRAPAARYGLNPKMVAKWRQRTTTADQPMGPSHPRSTVLSEAEEAIVVEFRRRTLLPLDDVLGCSAPRASQNSRAVHCCLVRHGIARLPKDPENASKRQRFAETKIGYVHIDACELRSAGGKTHLFLASDRVSKFVYVEFHPAVTMLIGAAFLRSVVAAFPYRLHTVLTDNGISFADQPRYRKGPTARIRDGLVPTTAIFPKQFCGSAVQAVHSGVRSRSNRGPFLVTTKPKITSLPKPGERLTALLVAWTRPLPVNPSAVAAAATLEIVSDVLLKPPTSLAASRWTRLSLIVIWRAKRRGASWRSTSGPRNS